MDTPHVIGEWAQPEGDQSPNRLEMAITDHKARSGEGNGSQAVLALRDTYDPGRQITFTAGQFQRLVQSAQQADSAVGRLLSAAGSGGTRSR